MEKKEMEVQKDDKYLIIKCPYCKSLYKVQMETLRKILDKGQTEIPRWIKGVYQ